MTRENIAPLASDDAAIVHRVLGGETNAFAILVERHANRVRRTCLTFTRDPAAAADCSQTTFLLALQKLSQFRSEARLSTWLVSIARNVALSHLRRRPTGPGSQGPIERESEDFASIELRDAGPDPEALSIRSQSRRLLAGAMQALSPTYRTVLILRDVQERSTGETARLLGISQPAVKTRLLRARRQMRVRLAPYWRGAFAA